jgi:very-short-patch-repair endonuclease
MFIPSKNLVVEVQGPYHYNGLGCLDKKTLMKTKIIKKLGYNYCELSTTELNQTHSHQYKVTYIKSKIRNALS